MASSVYEGLFRILQVQGLVVCMLLLSGKTLFEWFGIPQGYIHLFYIDLAAVSIQVILLGILNVLFNLDKLTRALYLSLFLLAANSTLTYGTFFLNPVFFGFGFLTAMGMTAVTGLFILSRILTKLDYSTFMLQ